MDNKTVLWIVVAIVVIGGAWYLLANTASNGAAPTAGNGTPTQGSPSYGTVAPKGKTQTSGEGSIRDLLALNKNLVCTIALTTPGNSRWGTVYVANKEMRGDFIGTTNGVRRNISMIDDGKFLYAWTEGNAKGLQLSAVVSASGSALSLWGAIDPVVTFDYVCHPWAVDTDLFVPPTDVVFSNSVTH